MEPTSVPIVTEYPETPEEPSQPTVPSSPDNGTGSPDVGDPNSQPGTGNANDELLGAANRLFAEGRYEEARASYLNAVFKDSNDGYAKLLHGLSSFALQDYDAATVAVRGALATTAELIEDPIDVRSFYKDSAVFDTQIDALSRRVNESTERAPTAQDREYRFLLAYLLFASASPDRAGNILEDLAASGSGDNQVTELLKAVKRVRSLNRP